MLFENKNKDKEILCKENDGSTPSTESDWSEGWDDSTAIEQENYER